MVLNMKKDPSLDDDYIDIRYRQITSAIDQISELCKDVSMLFGEQEGKKFQIDIQDILYIEWVDSRSCICTSENVYTTPQKLHQLEQQLISKGFLRISKPMLVNVYKIKWVSSGLNMRLVAELINGERISINRHYRDDLLEAIYKLDKESV